LLSLYSRSPGTNGVTAVLLITSLLSHLSSALRHLVTLARLHGVHDLNNALLSCSKSIILSINNSPVAVISMTVTNASYTARESASNVYKTAYSLQLVCLLLPMWKAMGYLNA
ncbi:hypothetical protein C8J55DRAFT_527888, partial [Lentinula edodes]